MKTEEIIQKLKDANVYAECPCGGEFKLSETMRLDNSFSESSGLWDGTNIIIKRDQLKNLKEYAGKIQEQLQQYEKELQQESVNIDFQKKIKQIQEELNLIVLLLKILN